ncbi:uncharacterized protein, partial [Watersipora subatra]|uniref:uncharacterized protein n=1 Tax=Watersipora subatra TaxID=2589382 RepID=UPI00355AD675
MLSDVGTNGGKARVYHPVDKENSAVELLHGSSSSTTSRVQIAAVTEKNAKEQLTPLTPVSLTSSSARRNASTHLTTISADIRMPVFTTLTTASSKGSEKEVEPTTQLTTMPITTSEKGQKPLTTTLSTPGSTTLQTTPKV